MGTVRKWKRKLMMLRMEHENAHDDVRAALEEAGFVPPRDHKLLGEAVRRALAIRSAESRELATTSDGEVSDDDLVLTDKAPRRQTSHQLVQSPGEADVDLSELAASFEAKMKARLEREEEEGVKIGDSGRGKRTLVDEGPRKPSREEQLAALKSVGRSAAEPEPGFPKQLWE